MTREEENQLIEIAARWEAVCDVLDGEEVSDFMMSFPEVLAVYDLMLGDYQRGYEQALADNDIAYGDDAERFLANMADAEMRTKT